LLLLDVCQSLLCHSVVEVMFSILFVGVFVSRTAKKVIGGFSPNLVSEYMIGEELI